MRAARWIVAVIAFLAAATYAIGGRGLIRQLLRSGRTIRSTATEALQPPTEAEMQRATESTQAAAADPLRSATPVSLRVVVISVAGILVAVTVLFFVTGREPRRRA